MDGRGQNISILVERLWRTVKYQEVYFHEYRTVSKARQSLEAYFRFYNTERLPKGLGYHTPYDVYFGHTASKKSVEMGILNDKNGKTGGSKMHLKQASLLSKEWGAPQSSNQSISQSSNQSTNPVFNQPIFENRFCRRRSLPPLAAARQKLISL